MNSFWSVVINVLTENLLIVVPKCPTVCMLRDKTEAFSVSIMRSVKLYC